MAPDELADDGRVERRATLADAAHRRGELLQVGDAVLEQVADALGAFLEQHHRVAGLDVLREHEHAGVGELRPDLAGRDEPLVGVGRWHADVDDRDLGLVHRDVAHQVGGVVGLGENVEAGLDEQPHDALAQQDRVLGDHHGHRVAQHRHRVAERREVARQAVGEELMDVLRRRQAREAVAAEVADGEPGRSAGRCREQDLAAVARRADPRRAVDVDARVALVGDERLADVDSHPHPDVVTAGPGLLDQAPLGLDGGGDRVVERREGDEHLVAVRVDHVAVPLSDRAPDDAADAVQDRRVVGPCRVDEWRRAFDVAEEEGDRFGCVVLMSTRV